MHAILTFRSLPLAGMAAWKMLLDCYVFDDENPAAHLPEARRGILGKLTAEQVAGLREKIRRYLWSCVIRAQGLRPFRGCR